MHVVIAGCGDLGTAAGLRFHQAGHTVVGLRRSPELLPTWIEGRAVDLRHDAPVISADTGVVVVALAAGSRDTETYRATYVDGLRHVLDAVDASGSSPRVVVVSSTAVYGGDVIVTEDTPATGGTETADVLIEAEGLLRSRVPDATLVRLSGIYGPGRTRLIDQVRSGRATVVPGPGRSPMTNRIHRDDAAAALVHLATLDAAPPLVIGTDDEPVRRDEVLRFLAAELGAGPLPEASADVPVTDKRLSNALLKSSGFSFRYPTYREGYRAVIAGDGIRYA